MRQIPLINPAQTDEQGRRFPGPPPAMTGVLPVPQVASPLDLSKVGDIIGTGSGAHQSLSQGQFPKMPELPGEPAPEAGAAEGAAGVGEAAGGAAAAEELLPLALLA